MSLPTDDKSRKALPIFTGPLMYFPDALLAIAAVCKAGNDQHNPGEPLHWAREKSTDQLNTALRHMMDHGGGTRLDVDGTWHLAKAAWRLLAELQLSIEEAQGKITRGKDGVPHAIPPAIPVPVDDKGPTWAVQQPVEGEPYFGRCTACGDRTVLAGCPACDRDGRMP
jgi:hypothetical protein